MIEGFEHYIEEFYKKDRFTNSAYYFHRRTIEMIRENEYDKLFINDKFLEYVYATLSAWGVDRLGRNGLAEFNVFKEIIRKRENSDLLRKLNKHKINKLEGMKKEEVKNELKNFLMD